MENKKILAALALGTMITGMALTSVNADSEDDSSTTTEISHEMKKGEHKGGKMRMKLTDDEKTSLETMSDDEKTEFFDSKKEEMEENREEMKTELEAIKVKVEAWEELSDDEQTILDNMKAKAWKGNKGNKGERGEMKSTHSEELTDEQIAERTEMKTQLDSIKAKLEAEEELTEEEQTTLDNFKGKSKGNKGHRGEKTSD